MTALIWTAPAGWVWPGSNGLCAARSFNRGGQKPTLRIVRALFAALGDPTGMTALRLGAFERIGFLLADWRHTKLRLADVEQRTTGVLDQLQLTELVTSIPGLSPVGRRRSWPRPATRDGLPPPGRW